MRGPTWVAGSRPAMTSKAKEKSFDIATLSDRKELGFGLPEPGHDLQARDQDGREQRSYDAYAERHGKALHRPRAQEKHEEARHQRGEMAVEDGAEGAFEARLQRRDQGTAAADFLADALVDQHI